MKLPLLMTNSLIVMYDPRALILVWIKYFDAGPKNKRAQLTSSVNYQYSFSMIYIGLFFVSI